MRAMTFGCTAFMTVLLGLRGVAAMQVPAIEVPAIDLRSDHHGEHGAAVAVHLPSMVAVRVDLDPETGEVVFGRDADSLLGGLQPGDLAVVHARGPAASPLLDALDQPRQDLLRDRHGDLAADAHLRGYVEGLEALLKRWRALRPDLRYSVFGVPIDSEGPRANRVNEAFADVINNLDAIVSSRFVLATGDAASAPGLVEGSLRNSIGASDGRPVFYRTPAGWARHDTMDAPRRGEASADRPSPNLSAESGESPDSQARTPDSLESELIGSSSEAALGEGSDDTTREIDGEWHGPPMAALESPSLEDELPASASGEAATGIIVAPIDQGMWLPEDRLILITEAQLFGERVAQRRRRHRTQGNTEFIVRSLTELHINDAVVHIDHGVGRYRGLQTLTTDGQTNEFLMLEYANASKLYVPVTSLHLISRYSGSDQETAPLNHLGTDQWQKTKRKAAEKIRDVAAELLEIYARREAKQGYKYTTEAIDYEKFSASFPFEETADQEAAIDAVIGDMVKGRAMDRLVCGDVGFGKTEVAMRAAFVAVQNGKQVAMLVPTTLLAQQHYESFRDRFADWPIAIDVISRFRSGAEQGDSLKRVAAGKTDVLIGTHKLLYADIDYSNLGLLIIDEEHRFGVRQKERLKALRANVDILTLTATPIPRTLNMALSNIRDLSLIVTPPARRLSVKTFIREQQDSLVKEAVSRELLRGGQVFYLHNEVKTIERAAEHLQEIVPSARIGIAHGQMPERTLEKVMADFYHKRYNILVCTTIIETGIDIPSANTILIHRADKFGLAQLHQLRGRVGRSHHQAYAYLLLPSHSQLAPDAHKRIDAIQAASDLGAGFTLASHDLEIRGAGELLGEEQSGHMQKIGFSLYTEMLEETVRAIKSGRTPSLDFELDKSIEVNLRIPALIPEEYLPDVHTRLIMYKRISASTTQDELVELQVEMIDRFGLLPRPLQLLFKLTRLKLLAAPLGIRKIDVNVSSGRIEFGSHTEVDPLSVITLVQEQPRRFKLGGAHQLQFSHECQDADAKLELVSDILGKLRRLQPDAA